MNKKHINKQILKYFWQKAKKYPWRLAAYFILVIIAVSAQTFGAPMVMKEIFDLMAEGSKTPEIVFDQIKHWIFILGCVYFFAEFISWRLADAANIYFQPKVMRDIEKECFGKLQNHSHKFFAENFAGSLVSRLGRMSRSFEMVADVIQWNLWPIFIRLVGATIIIYYFAPIISLIFLVWTILFVIASFWYARWTRQFWADNAAKDSLVTADLADAIGNIYNTKVFAAQDTEKKRFGKTINLRCKSRIKAWLTGNLMAIWQGISMILLQLTMVYFMADAWKHGTMTIGTIFAINSFVWIAMHNIWNMGRQFQDFSNALADAEEMMQILLLEPEVKDSITPEKSRISAGEIKFQKVDFAYKSGENKIFEDFDLMIHPGEKVGIVGTSGAGKSTLVHLLLRFADIQSGQILIDGQNIANIMQNDLRSAISLVPQESVLFHRSLAENIRYGNPNATDEQVIRAAKSANAHEFISQMPLGYDTLVGERGIKLSGGQKQRIAIARAILEPSNILVLDEATSALDSESEGLIQKSLEHIFTQENRTTIVIAHRLSTLKKMDRIIVLEQGKVSQSGTHQKLIELDGKYADLWKHQVGGFITE